MKRLIFILALMFSVLYVQAQIYYTEEIVIEIDSTWPDDSTLFYQNFSGGNWGSIDIVEDSLTTDSLNITIGFSNSGRSLNVPATLSGITLPYQVRQDSSYVNGTAFTNDSRRRVEYNTSAYSKSKMFWSGSFVFAKYLVIHINKTGEIEGKLVVFPHIKR